MDVTPVSIKEQHISLPIYNLNCGGGGSLIVEHALARTPGVIEVYVNPVTEMAYISFDPEQCTPESLAVVIGRVGYGPRR